MSTGGLALSQPEWSPCKLRIYRVTHQVDNSVSAFPLSAILCLGIYMVNIQVFPFELLRSKQNLCFNIWFLYWNAVFVFLSTEPTKQPECSPWVSQKGQRSLAGWTDHPYQTPPNFTVTWWSHTVSVYLDIIHLKKGHLVNLDSVTVTTWLYTVLL